MIDRILLRLLIWTSSVFTGLAMALAAAHAEWPKVWTAVLGLWTFLAVLGLLHVITEPRLDDD